ncbi:MAG TPA: DUF4350 domain-containing protein [Gemmatimonadales bacterium]|jgi:hypothetical protein|nr:DUF4350 domain-containing protein [Gemmatimonadales bacterium]
MSYRLEIGLALLLAGAIAVAVLAANRTAKPPESDSRASTFLSGPDGSKALHEVLVRLGHPSERRRTPLFTLAEDSARRPALLVVLDPPLPLQSAELEQVALYVKAGGAVLVAGDGGGITGCTGWDTARPGGGARIDSVPVRSPRPGLELPRAAAVLKRAPERRLEGLVKRRVAQLDDPCGVLIPHGTDTLLAALDGRPLALRFHYSGGGTITLVADPGWFRNLVWRDTDVPYVVLPLLTPRRRGRVAWDEYHQGFGRAGPSLTAYTWEWLRHSPAGWAVLQLVAVGLVWLAVTAVRFGPARSVIERRRRSPLEHLEALAAGLESAAAVDTAVQRMVSGLRRRLRRTGEGNVGTTQLKAWLASLELAMPSARGRAGVRRLQRLMSQPGGPERVLAAAQAVEDVWEELRPRTTRDAF